MKSIALIGFMGTGKTTIGKALAERLHMPFVDLDAVIVEEQQMEIDEIFARYGETQFRSMEHDALCRAAARENTIISPGGGAVLQAENRAVLNKHCCVISLSARPEVILERVDADDTVRPVLEHRLPGQTKLARIKEVLESRAAYYQEAAYCIDTSEQSVEQLTEQIVQWLTEQNQ